MSGDGFFIKCKVCGWDMARAVESLDGEVWPTSSVIGQAALVYTIFTGHMQIHIIDSLMDIEEAIRESRKPAP